MHSHSYACTPTPIPCNAQVEEIHKLQSGIDQFKREANQQREDRVAVQTKLEEVQAELVTKQEGWGRLEEEWAAERKRLVSEVEQMKKERGALQEQYASQVRRRREGRGVALRERLHCMKTSSLSLFVQLKSLQDSHAQMLASRDQEGASHRLQMQRTQEQDRHRAQETARIRAQVAALSSELAIERRVAEEAQQQLALARAETARYQAQASSLQRALTMNNYTSHLHSISSQPSPTKPTAAPANQDRSIPAVVSSPAVPQLAGTSLNLPHSDATTPVQQNETGPPLVAVGMAQNDEPHPKEPGSPGRESVMSDLAEFHSLPPPNLSPPSLNPPKTTPTQSTQ